MACDLRKRVGAPGRIRTCDTRFRRAVLYPLSYEGGGGGCADHGHLSCHGGGRSDDSDRGGSSYGRDRRVWIDPTRRPPRWTRRVRSAPIGCVNRTNLGRGYSPVLTFND